MSLDHEVVERCVLPSLSPRSGSVITNRISATARNPANQQITILVTSSSYGLKGFVSLDFSVAFWHHELVFKDSWVRIPVGTLGFRISFPLIKRLPSHPRPKLLV